MVKMVSDFILIWGVYELVKRMSLWLKIFILLLFYVHVRKQYLDLRHRLFVMPDIKIMPALITKLEVNAIDTYFINDEPGLMIGSAVARTKKSRKVPVLLVNNTNKTFKIKRGCVIGRINAIDETSIEPSTMEATDNKASQDPMTEFNVPPEHRPRIERLVDKNNDLFAI